MKTRAVVLAMLMALISCSRPHPITVASKNFTEQIILGEIAAQQLERKLHIQVRRRLNLGGTLLTHEAIMRGDIDIYPEYTGTGASVVLKQSVPRDPAQAYLAVKTEYLRRFLLVWLPPLGFNDTFAMAVRAQDARQLGATSLSSAGKRRWRLGIGYEFLTRPDGLKALDRTYALEWQGTPKSMDLGLLYQALRQNQVDMAAGNSTDAQLGEPGIAILSDDKNAFPPYNACFVVRQDLAAQRPDVRMALTMLQNRISEETMRALNRRVEIDHQPVEKVAADFLADQP